MSVLLCKYSDAPTPANSKSYYEGLAVNTGSGGHADFWNDVSFGGVSLQGSVVQGWYTLDQTEAEARAYGGGGSSDRIKKFTDCRDKAADEGYTAPADHIVIVITSPGIDTFGFSGGAFLGENANVGVMAHEVGHGMDLKHSFSDDSSYQNATWSAPGEYDDLWDTMSYANVYSKNTGSYGNGGPGLNAYHRDRLGWLRKDKIFRFGADGASDRTLTLTALNRPNNPGFQMVRIPFDTGDRYHYYTVEYRVDQDWDSGFPSDIVLIHEIDEGTPNSYLSYLLRDTALASRAPVQSLNRNGVRIDIISTDAASNSAVVRVRSTKAAQWCLQGYVWREASPTDKVCVTPARRTQVANENAQAESHQSPNGGAFGPETCLPGYVWREAFPGDRVCVTPSSRTLAANENLEAMETRLGSAAYGPNICTIGHVWREADLSDWVCVTPERRSEVAIENALAPSRVQPGGGAYGPDTCKPGFVWREAFTGDHACVTPASRSTARSESETANDRLAKKGA